MISNQASILKNDRNLQDYNIIGTVTARGRRSERSYEVGVDTGTSPPVLY